MARIKGRKLAGIPEVTPYVEDISLRPEIEAHHADDVLLYQRALRLRESRLAER